MIIKYSPEAPGTLDRIEWNGLSVPFGKNLGPAFYYKKERTNIPVPLQATETGFSGTADGICYTLSIADHEDHITIFAEIFNPTDRDYTPEAIGLKLGVDSYMVEFPQWNEAYFPTFMRCEKTHFWGYFMSPLQKAAAVFCDTPVAAWELDYNFYIPDNSNLDICHFGHRIHTANLLLLCQGPLPQRHPTGLDVLHAGERKAWQVHLMPLAHISEFTQVAAQRFGLPVIDFDRYTLCPGETAHGNIRCTEAYTVQTVSPSGATWEGTAIPIRETGLHTVTVTTASGKQAEATLYGRHSYAWYLDRARENAIQKPQKATTHTESWYGHFSTMLAKKHHPIPELDALAQANFDEIVPLMFDLDAGVPKVSVTRVQNYALMISLLVDAYEADPAGGRPYLDQANRLAAFLISKQASDGAYYRESTHYTAVIYLAKSMLELALCEKEQAADLEFAQRYSVHYASAKAAVENLCRLRETIGTEGEHTFEDGMISCSALQLGYYALTLPESERKPFIDAAEHMLAIHRCLEQNIVPDCRMRGGSLRFWEAQYDVMIRGNMLNSPHGWTSWKNYATYYLYLLTGKEEYLRETMDTLGACIQMIDEQGDLRWSFIVDPYLDVKVMVPDETQAITDGYASAGHLTTKAYRGKYEYRIFGECYVDMVSGWYRTGKDQLVTGGYALCPLMLPDGPVRVDNQGGACDNDVHEHFKCLEETILGKAFVLLRPDGSLLTYNCTAEWDRETLVVTFREPCTYVHVNTPRSLCLLVNNQMHTVSDGMTMLEIN